MALVPMLKINPQKKKRKSPKYTLEIAKSFYHELKLTDEKSLKAIEEMEMFKKNQFKIIAAFKEPKDEIIFEIRHCMNKLTADVEVITRNADKIIHSNFFGTELFIEIFSQLIVESAINQFAFVQVYTRFLQEIFLGMPTDEQKKILITEIYKIIFDKPEKSPHKAFFIGCLVPAQLVDPGRVLEIVKKLLSNVNTETMEALFHLMIFSGKALEEKYDDFEDIVSEMTSAACNTDVKQRVRFQLLDLLDVRMNGWETGSLMPNLVTLQDEQPERKEHRPDGIDMSILREYVKGGSVPETWTEKSTYDLMYSLCVSSFGEYENGVNIIHELVGRKDAAFTENAIPSLRKVSDDVDDQSILQEFPYAVKTAGAIFVQLVLNGFDVNLFGTDEFPFKLGVFSGIVSEADRINRADILSSSMYMKELKFLPALHSHSQIVSELDEINMTDAWPVYDAMNTLFKMIMNDESVDVVSKFLNVYLNQRIAKNPFLVEFITEIVVIQRPTKYQCFIEFIAKRPIEALSHIETIGEFFKWKPEQTAANIRKLSGLIHCDIERFKALSSRDFHDVIVKYL